MPAIRDSVYSLRFTVYSFLLCTSLHCAGQVSSSSASVTKILFVLDASGSMKGTWQGKSKFDLAKEILVQTIDSISASTPNVEFALRLMGHQYPRSENNCADTKLEVGFSKNNSSLIAEELSHVTPQGQTPIAFSLEQSLNDFGNDSLSTNAIILITDGEETCSGNLCGLAEKFEEKRIALKPYIVGLGLSDSLKKKFECIGTFYDVQSETSFGSVLNVVISRVLNRTSSQINLLDAYEKPTETNVEVTLYDHYSGKVRYNFVHTMNAKGNPDTLFPDPKGRYDLEVHTFPPVTKKNIQLVQGIHNTIAVDAPQEILDLQIEGTVQASFTNVQCLVRQEGHHEILNAQDLNTSQRYLAGKYDLEILTLPRIEYYDVELEQGKSTVIKIPLNGTLTVNPPEPGVAQLFLQDGNNLVKVIDYYKINAPKSISVQPGKYLVVFRPDKGKQSSKTRLVPVTVSAGKTMTIKL